MTTTKRPAFPSRDSVHSQVSRRIALLPSEVKAVRYAAEALLDDTGMYPPAAATLRKLFNRWTCVQREVIGESHAGCQHCGGVE